MTTKPAQPPIELSGAVGGALLFYRSEIDGLAKWTRSMGMKGVEARPRDTEAECWAAIGLATTHLAGPSGERLSNANDPTQVVPIISSHVALVMAVFRTLSNPFIERGHVDGPHYDEEIMSLLGGFVTGFTLLSTQEQRCQAVSRGANIFSCLAEHKSGLAYLDFIANTAESWAFAIAEHNIPRSNKSFEAMEILASQISIIHEGLRTDLASG
jgi:hypothetical protein